eukprot:GCRY01000084.1.p1 GENE.GCRY01000084.1~~GCRY01000084.1.p1  ORF type:complete len:177 (+),score=41.22 GCRY01000084.1:151-681(+)
MGKAAYSKKPENDTKSCKAKGSDLRVHYKNTREAAMTIKGMTLERAKAFLNHVIEKKECVPFRRYKGDVGRNAQAKQWKVAQGRWPQKSCTFLLQLLQNAESNAEQKNLEVSKLVVSHIQVNQAAKQRRRTYRAHGRINPYMANPCHIEMILAENDTVVPKGEVEKATKAQKKITE